ncbi:Protein disulfide-isomerase 5-4 [Symbiodinium microadriaticum]|uniref:Protein disulfide-isomerase 5-4 n=1 Tax=Symbiodinium microadriaticum TaxID=2951 RepID=A0A1Q9DCX2_SYMMI|nr:Protein disulfide-isomerase 5-4 [Symbiodinium microadriaticum]CAE7237695.1 PDIL5-4 [Symbiodinium microadriaticum]
MPQLNFKRLLVEYKKVQSAISAGQAQGILRCEPVGDNMLEWDVDMTFPEGSPLQTSLDALAESMFDAEMKKLTLSVRFPAEYPLSPPEVWLRRPRMRHCSEHAGAVTFGGRVCSLTLASPGWNPVTAMLSVLEDVRRLGNEGGTERKKQDSYFKKVVCRVKMRTLVAIAVEHERSGTTPHKMPNGKARGPPRDFVEASQIGGTWTLIAYGIMLVVFLFELASFMSPGYTTMMTLDKAGSDLLQINFDVDVHDIECRNLQLVVYAQNGKEKLGVLGEDFWLRSIDASGKTFGVSIKPQEYQWQGQEEDDHDKVMQKVRQQDGAEEIDSDWASSHDGFKHKSFEHVIQGHDFTFINFFAGWCSHCQKFAPEWDQIAEKIHGKGDAPAMKFPDKDGIERPIRLIKLNCVDFKETCVEKGIDAYPTLRLYKADGSFTVYDGRRGEAEIVRWLERMAKMRSYGWGKHHETFERGCNARGRLQVPRVPGHLELMAGGGDQTLNPRMTNVSHTIKHLSFSDAEDDTYSRKTPLLAARLLQQGWKHFPGEVTRNLAPLDGRKFVTSGFHQAYIHDLKVVSTVAGKETSYQFQHQARISKLPEAAIPQAQFHYDIEPFSIHVKTDEKRWYDFGTSLCAVLGGAFVVLRLASRFSVHLSASLKLGAKAQRGGAMSIGHFE